MKTNTLLTHPGDRPGRRPPGDLRCALVLTLLLLTGLLTSVRAASAPAYMSYQGYLTTSAGSALASGTYDVIFRIYDGAGTGAVRKWSEQQAVTVSDGNFSVLLGEGTAVSNEENAYATLSELFSPQRTTLDRYVGITVDGQGSEITPRLQLVTTPFAFMADTAAKLRDNSVSYDGSSTVTISEALTVDKAAELKSGLAVTGTTDVSANDGGVLKVIMEDAVTNAEIGRMRLDDDEIQAVAGDGTASRLNLNIDGGGVILGKSGSANTIYGSTTINGNTTIDGTATLKSTLSVTEATTLESTLSVAGNTTIGGTTTLNGNTTISGTKNLYVAGGKLGIGTTAPTYNLDVVGSGDVQIGLKNTDTDRHWTIQSSGTTGVGKFKIIDRTASAARLEINTSGYVYLRDRLGIGTSSPSVPLDIATTGTANYDREVLLRTSSPYVDDRSESAQNHSSVSIYTAGTIVAPLFNVYSDIRIKEIVDSPPGEASLDTIMKLKVTDYRMRDWIAHGKSVRRGLIAQEVEKVFPRVVSRNRRFVPDIYALARAFNFDAATKTLRIETASDHGLKVDDVVRVMADDVPVESRVEAVADSTRFTLGDWERPVKDLFLYGKRVDDFRTVDYDQVFSTGIAAIQEVNRKLEVSNKELRSSLTAVTEENARLSRELSSVMDRLLALEALTK